MMKNCLIAVTLLSVVPALRQARADGGWFKNVDPVTKKESECQCFDEDKQAPWVTCKPNVGGAGVGCFSLQIGTGKMRPRSILPVGAIVAPQME